MTDFTQMPKIPRLSRDVIITEKIDGTNASIYIPDPADPEADGVIRFGSRTRWITPEADNYGFARWATEHLEELKQLGPGHHFGEWWGRGIQRGYNQIEKKFSLFNVSRWDSSTAPRTPPAIVSLVPVLKIWTLDTAVIDATLRALQENGSVAAPGFMFPEGVVVFHVAGRVLFKKTLDKNDGAKGD